MKLQACLNGARQPGSHPALPQTPKRLAQDALNVQSAGAEAIHLHLWSQGRETLTADVLRTTLRAVRRVTPALPVGVSTGLWICGSASERLHMVEAWAQLTALDRPDFASVNLEEEGAVLLGHLLLALDIGIEAGLTSVADAERLEQSGWAHRCLRHLIELPAALEPAAALSECERIHERLDRRGSSMDGAVPRLTHGTDANAWALIEEARRRGDATRIGLEDVLTLPDGQLAPDNTALVVAARYTDHR